MHISQPNLACKHTPCAYSSAWRAKLGPDQSMEMGTEDPKFTI